ncbi:MAG: SpoIIE family protein phosphatase [Bacteroidota bacterium]
MHSHEKKALFWKLSLAMLLLLGIGAQNVYAQQYISGQVVRPTGEIIMGATVKIDNSSPVISDKRGQFRVLVGATIKNVAAVKENYTYSDWEFREDILTIVMDYTPKKKTKPVFYVKGQVVDHLGQGIGNANVTLPSPNNVTRAGKTKSDGYFAITLDKEFKLSEGMIFLLDEKQVDGRFFKIQQNGKFALITVPQGGIPTEGEIPENTQTEEVSTPKYAYQIQILDAQSQKPLPRYLITYADKLIRADKKGIATLSLDSQTLEESEFNLQEGDELTELKKSGSTWQIMVEVSPESSEKTDTATQNSDTSSISPYTDQVNETLEIIDQERAQLARTGAKLESQIEDLAKQLNNSSNLTPSQTRELRREISRLRAALQENQKSFEEAQERTRRLLSQVSDMMEESQEQNEKILRWLAILGGLSVFIGLLAFIFFGYARRIKRQKTALEQVNKSMNLLGKIGQDLTSKLSLTELSHELYEDVNALMDANVFALGVHQPSMKRLFFPASIENGETLQPYFYGEEEVKEYLSVRSLLNQEEIIIRNFKTEAKDYIDITTLDAKALEAAPQSVIYLPLVSDTKTVGVLTVQSYVADAYSDYQLGLLRNIAVYVAIAVENAKVYGEIASQNLKITQSINYAKRIQSSIFPEKREVKAFFKDFFVFYRPRDIVSGDFYYFHQHADGKAFIAGVDCTGHGVPGGFMSLIGHELLNDLIVRQHIEDPAEILNQLHKGIVRQLHQDTQNSQDGMEVTLCVFDAKQTEMQVASSHMPVMVYNEKRPEKMIEIKGDRISIGGVRNKTRESFQTHTLSLQAGDHVYFFSDGFQDQFGGPENRKYLKKRLRTLLKDIQSQKTMSAQENQVAKAFDTWKGTFPQIDDVLLIGLEIQPQKP